MTPPSGTTIATYEPRRMTAAEQREAARRLIVEAPCDESGRGIRPAVTS